MFSCKLEINSFCLTSWAIPYKIIQVPKCLCDPSLRNMTAFNEILCVQKIVVRCACMQLSYTLQSGIEGGVAISGGGLEKSLKVNKWGGLQ